MSAPQAFRKRVQDHKAPATEPQVVRFFLETTDVDEDGNEFVVRHDDFTAEKPSDERLFLFMAAAGDSVDAGNEPAAVMSLLKDVLPKPEYRTIVQRLKDPEDEVDMDMLGDVIEYLFKEWNAFPTQPQSGSASSQTGTGQRSTGRSRSKTSTRSP